MSFCSEFEQPIFSLGLRDNGAAFMMPFMAASLFLNRCATNALAEYLEHEPPAKGGDAEERLVLCGLAWQGYLAMDKVFGDDRPDPRFYYLDEELEIMTTSGEHERIKEWFGGLVDIYSDAVGIEITPRGQATMRAALQRAGAEPDKSWSIGEIKTFPEIVLEVALTSGGVKKLEIYRRLQIPEVWIWQKSKLEVYALSADGSEYNQIGQSFLLPTIDISLLERCVMLQSWNAAKKAFRTGLTEK